MSRPYRPGFRPFLSDEESAAAREELEQHERDVLARACNEQAARNTAAMLLAAHHLLAEVVGLYPPGKGVTLDRLAARLKLHSGSEAFRGLSLLLSRASDVQNPDRESRTLREVQASVSASDEFTGIRYAREDGRRTFDRHPPDHAERDTPYEADAIVANRSLLEEIERLRLRVRVLEAENREADNERRPH
jgi:hypothetical protein